MIKICGYLIMAAFPTYWGFFAGAMVLATGTAVFKPGIQGTLVKATKRENSSLAWGIFYQTVNIGGFLGPLMAGYMRKLEWRYVFLSCAAIICLNFLLLFTYQEPGKAERIAAQATQPKVTAATAIAELRRPHVWPYLLIFSGFWFMFNAIFDVLPAHLDDWVDTRDIVTSLFGANASPGAFVSFFVNMNEAKTEILPEGMLNVNAMLIMITCFAFAWLSGKMKAIHSMVLGTLLASLSMVGVGLSMVGWVAIGAIAVFSVGEMLSSPKFSEYVGNFAPADKKAMYLGFGQIPIAIGWTLEGKLGMTMYDHFSSKERFAREMLVEKGMSAADVAAIPQGEGFLKLCELLGQDKFQVTQLLLQTHNPGLVWLIIAGVGVLSAGGIWWYGTWVKKLSATEAGARA